MKQLLLITLTYLFCLMNASAQDLIIDDRSSGNIRSTIGADWRLLTDRVMGGVSQGSLSPELYRDKKCLRMKGEVSTENNGGFVQMALDLNGGKEFDASNFQGLELMVTGNNEVYNLHYRTSGLWMPWQSYRASFKVTPQWGIVQLPFSMLTPYRTGKQFKPDQIKRIGLVAIGKNFNADLCVASVKFYGKK